MLLLNTGIFNPKFLLLRTEKPNTTVVKTKHSPYIKNARDVK